MCGIVGYIGPKSCVPLVFEGLKHLEYRGYDSAGIVVSASGALHIAKAEGKLSELGKRLEILPAGANVGMGHTRWATHGAPTEVNAHPHAVPELAVVQNGIIENYQELKDELTARGAVFLSQTDTEAIVHVLAEELRERPRAPRYEVVLRCVARLRGAFAFSVMFRDEPDAMYLVKYACPAVVGLGQGENFFASDALALVKHTNRVVFMNDGEMARVTREGATFWNFAGREIRPKVTMVNMSPSAMEKCGFKHYMLKEIHEQANVVSQTAARLVDRKTRVFDMAGLGLDAIDVKSVRHIRLVACGTAFHAGLVARYPLERDLRIPVDVELASEFRYRQPMLSKDTLVIAVSQSGETADTLASVKHARECGCQVLSVCNVRMSSIPRSSTSTLYMDAGPEIGVASTKAFTSQIFCLYLASTAMGLARGTVSAADVDARLGWVDRLPHLLSNTLNVAEHVERVAMKYSEGRSCLFVGRSVSFPLALEGALKLKEISYIHAEGYAGGELKHGPIALVDRHMPIMAVCPMDGAYEKMISNIEEVRAREGRIIGVGVESDSRLRELCEDYLPCPRVGDDVLQAIVSTIPLQLFAYYVAVARGTDVDQPRNLAKSVTVE